ncbi:MAG: epoxide hydrolase [bacterium]|nr:epoxide hydrolase [Deltaproteobacteria bacterium]MCP4906982.1 epoxide hydrolase [bacterium]
MKPESFRIEIPDEDLVDLSNRLKRFRASSDFANDDWRYGMNGSYLRELVDYWIDGFDWRREEAVMNAFEHWRVEIDHVPIHYLKKSGVGPNPTPIVLTHGWPWTFWDYRYVIEPLADPAAHGGDPADAFDVIVPSLPGFGFSSPLQKPGINWIKTADLWSTLMTDVLGHERYAAAGGDWGAFVTAQLGHKYADQLYGVHEAFPAIPGLNYYDVAGEDYAPEEADLYARRLVCEPLSASHMAVHSSDPQTLAYALEDSPAGLAAWIVERRRNWSDCGGNVESAFTRDHLLTTVSLFWLTRTIGTSMRFYWETAREPWRPSHDRRPTIEAPAAFAVLPQDVFPLPRKTVEQHVNLQRWSRLARGGHFGAAEAPDLIVDDIRAFFRERRALPD